MSHQRIIKGTTRWFSIENGEVFRHTVKPGEQPQPHWVRGLGPCDRTYADYLTGERFRGVPKSAEQKRKMREAKLGVAKSPEHRTNMSEAHKERHRQIRAVADANGCSWREACRIYREGKNRD
jgi:hypothetical protein